MRTITQVFGAGEVHRWAVQGSYFRLMEISAGAVADVRILKNGAERTAATGVDAGYSYKAPEDFNGVEITCAAACTIKIAISDGTGTYDRLAANVTISGNPTVLAKTGATIATGSVVAVGTAAVVAAAATANTKALYFRADDANAAPIYLGSSGVTTATGAIKLNPGETFIDDRASEAAWYAISSAAGQNLRVMRGS